MSIRVFVAAGLRPLVQMTFVHGGRWVHAAPTGPVGQDGYLANTHNVMRHFEFNIMFSESIPLTVELV